MTVRWADLGLAGSSASVRNLWTATTIGNVTTSFSVGVSANDSVLLGVTGTEGAVTTFEADDFTAHGKVMDAFFAGGGVEIMQAISGADSPIASWQSSTYVDVPR